MNRTLSEYLTKEEGFEGQYEDDEGCMHQDPTDLLTSLLGFCGCGMPDKALEYIRLGLEQVSDGGGYDHARFGSGGAAYFFYYWCDKEALVEHGVGLPGWLTDKGKNFLSLLREWSELQEAGVR